ncbi:MAG: glutamate-cysteine ligase family protein, partial [Gemmatimonadota bacterium]
MSRLRLFDAYGVELEYMIVDAASLAARPLADRLLVDDDGIVRPEVEHGPISWSNELVSHVLELKTTTPAPSLDGLETGFAGSVREANARLAPLGCVLLGTGAHPFFDPHAETVIWPGEYTEVYRTYDRIFGVRGHGWSNLQSVHLNLPFGDDVEFGRLHAAIRLVLPIIPALAASTPYLDGRRTDYLDSRLHVYRHNQDRVPELVGQVVP